MAVVRLELVEDSRAEETTKGLEEEGVFGEHLDLAAEGSEVEVVVMVEMMLRKRVPLS